MRSYWPVIALICLVAVRPPLADAHRAYLFIEGIPGESTVEGREGWIDLHSVAPVVAPAVGGGSPIPEMVLIKELDKSSPKLYERCADGQTAPIAMIDFVREDEDAVRFYRLFLKDVSVTGASVDADETGRPIEAISMDFTYIEWAYAEFDATGGKVGDSIAYWDLLNSSGGIVDLPPGNFRFRAAFTLSDDSAAGQGLLSWNGEAGKTYAIWYSPSPDLPFDTLVDTVSSDRTGPMSIVVNLFGDQGFFIVREVD